MRSPFMSFALAMVVASALIGGCFPPLTEDAEDTFVETSEQDTTMPPLDTAAPDTAAPDTAAPDTLLTDSSSLDTLGDSGTSDTEPPIDTAVIDTITPPDTAAADTSTLDTAAPTDTVLGDTSTTATCPGGCGHLDAACLRGFCDLGTCRAELLSDVACDDGDVCTVSDRCTDGVCGGLARVCDDGKDCSFDSCDAAAGGCVADLSACGCGGDDALCDDGNACNGHETCGADTLCHPGTAVVCTPSTDPCLQNACQPASGACVESPTNEDLPCDDGLHCTSHDRCHTGVCGGEAVDCDDGIDCTVTGCSESEGGCVELSDTCECDVDADCANTTLCDGGEVCNSKRACEGGVPVTCDDPGDVCLVSTCVPATGACVVQNASTSTSCDDGDACTVGDRCQAGACKSGNPASDAFGDWNRAIGLTTDLVPGFQELRPVAHPGGHVTVPLVHGPSFPIFTVSHTTPATTLSTNGATYALHLVTYPPTGVSVATGLVATLEHTGSGGPTLAHAYAPLPGGNTAVVVSRTSSTTPITLTDGTTLPSGWAALLNIDVAGQVAWRRMLESSGFAFTQIVKSGSGENGVLLGVMHDHDVVVHGAPGQVSAILPGPSTQLSLSLARFDDAGTRLWTKQLVSSSMNDFKDGVMGANGQTLLQSTVVASAGNLTLLGDPQPLSLAKLGTSQSDAVYVALDGSGNPEWVQAVTSQRPYTVSTGAVWSEPAQLWVTASWGVGDMAVYNEAGVEFTDPAPVNAGLGDRTLILAVDATGIPAWSRSFSGNIRTAELIAFEGAPRIAWLIHVTASTSMDDVTLAISPGESAVYAVVADTEDGHVVAARKVATYASDLGSISGPNLRLAIGSGDELLMSVYSSGTVSVGTAVLDEFSTVGSSYLLSRLNSGGALFCP